VPLLIDLALATSFDDVDEAAHVLRQALRVDPEEVARRVSADLMALLSVGEFREEVQQIYTTLESREDVRNPSLALLDHTAHEEQSGEQLPARAPGSRPELSCWALAFSRSGDSREAAVAAATQVARGAAHSVPHLIRQLSAANVLLLAGEVSSAKCICDAVVSLAQERRFQPVLALGLACRSQASLRLGELDNAAEDAHSAVALARKCGFREETSTFALMAAQLVRVLVEAGSLDEAFTFLRGAQAKVPELGSLGSLALLHEQGRLRLASGDLRGGTGDLLSCGQALVSRGIVNPAAFAWRSHAARGLAQLGDHEEARRLTDAELELARTWGAAETVAQALRVRALLEHSGSGLPVLDEALTLLRGTDDRLSLARALCERGQLLSGLDAESARQSFREAYDLAATFGSSGLLAEIRRELVLVGGRPPRARRQGIDSLTESERKVALLAARGQKNREIAAALYVGKRTIEIHLTNAYRKLGIGGRDELLALMAEDGRPVRPAEPGPPVGRAASVSGRA
jgi:DNA-binding CsgD family transcriptional regulator